jgi:Domain of unknown function (DUF4203)
LQDLFVALIAISIGLVAVFFGYRLFRAVLPIFGFVLGAIVGAQAVNLIFGDGMFSTILSIVTAVVVGLVFGVLAYAFWALGVILVVGGMGFAIGSALLPAFGLDADVISWVIGLAVGLGFAAAAFVLRLPRAIVTVVTALWGAGATLGGVMVLLQIIEPEQLGYGGVDAVVSESFIWLLAYIALAVVGAIFQAMTSAEIDTIWLDESTSNIAAPSRPPGG